MPSDSQIPENSKRQCSNPAVVLFLAAMAIATFTSCSTKSPQASKSDLTKSEISSNNEPVKSAPTQTEDFTVDGEPIQEESPKGFSKVSLDKPSSQQPGPNGPVSDASPSANAAESDPSTIASSENRADVSSTDTDIRDRGRGSSESESTPPSQSQGRKKPPVLDAESTLKKVNELVRLSQKSKTAKDFGKAYLQTEQAWVAARQHPKDVRLVEVSTQLLAELDSLGKLANKKYELKAVDSSTLLIEK